MKSRIKELIKDSNSIVLLTHESPDGDAIGSLIAFYRVLKDMGKMVEMISFNIPARFDYLADFDKILNNTDKEYDLAIVLDCATRERIGQIDNIVDRCKKVINIDHHISNTRYGDLNYIEKETSSCSQVLYYLFKDLEFHIDKETASALMLGLLTDTNGFKNNNVDKYSFMMAAEISDLGVDIYNLQREMLTIVTKSQFALMKLTLERLELFMDGKIAFSYITNEDIVLSGAEIGDHEGLVDLGRNILGVEVSIFVREDNGYRVSFRSNGLVDVSLIAKVFDGGGHKMAAGAKINKGLAEVKELLIEETKKAMMN